MGVRDEESKARIERHRQIRAGKGFVTLEHQVDIVNAISAIDEIDAGDFSTNPSENGAIVLLECMSNLVANEMFSGKEAKSFYECADKILEDVIALSKKTASLVIVSNNIFEDGISYDEDTKEYMRALGLINKRLAELSDEVYEVVVGIGIKI